MWIWTNFLMCSTSVLACLMYGCSFKNCWKMLKASLYFLSSSRMVPRHKKFDVIWTKSNGFYTIGFSCAVSTNKDIIILYKNSLFQWQRIYGHHRYCIRTVCFSRRMYWRMYCTGCQSHKGYSSRYEHYSTMPLMGLHQRIYLILVLKSMLIPRRRDLRSSVRSQLIPASHRRQFAERALAVGGPMLWNSLPDAVCKATSLTAFRRLQ